MFNGFTKESLKFLNDLANNNSKIWFEKNRAVYESHVLEPAKEFVLAFGKSLEEISNDFNAIPKIDKSIFRIYRDVRFSKDKSPYKTHLGLWFWEGFGPRMESSGFYFQIEPKSIFIGAGMYEFPKNIISTYRESVIHKDYGKNLMRAIDKVNKKSNYTIGGKHYKRVPRGFDPDHSNAEMLMYNGLHAGMECEIPSQLFSEELVQFCKKAFLDMLPIHNWLVEMKERVSG